MIAINGSEFEYLYNIFYIYFEKKQAQKSFLLSYMTTFFLYFVIVVDSINNQRRRRPTEEFHELWIVLEICGSFLWENWWITPSKSWFHWLALTTCIEIHHESKHSLRRRLYQRLLRNQAHVVNFNGWWGELRFLLGFLFW